MASVILGTLGAAIGGPIGQLIGSAIGSYIDSILFAPKPQDVKGPRLKDLATVRTDPGAPIPIVYGQDRVGLSTIFTSKLIETKKKKKSGGKGGAKKQTTITYTYHVDLQGLLCEGPIMGIGRIWCDGKILRGTREDIEASYDEDENGIEAGPLAFPVYYFQNVDGEYGGTDPDYDPKLLPKNLVAAQNNPEGGTGSPTWYIKNFDGPTGQFVPIDLTFQEHIDDSKIVYWKDAVTGYYIPTPASHAYLVNNNGGQFDGGGAGGGGGGEGAGGAGLAYRDWESYRNAYDALNDFSLNAMLQIKKKALGNIEFFNGHSEQLVDSYFNAITPNDSPAYRGRALLSLQVLQLADYGNRTPNITVEVYERTRTNAKRIIVDLMERTQLSEVQYNVEDINDEYVKNKIIGYGVASATSFRAAIESLMDFANVESAEVGSLIRFRQIDRTPDAIIDYSNFGTIAVGDNPKSQLITTRRRISSMPKNISMTYKDPYRDYQTNNVSYTRQIGSSSSNATMETAAVMFPRQAKRYVRDKLRRLWMERIFFESSLPPHFLFLSPTDIITVVDGAETLFEMKLLKTTTGRNGLLEIEGLDRTDFLYVRDEGEEDYIDLDDSNYNEPEYVDNNYTTNIILMDIPALIPDGDYFGQYIAASGASGAWLGTTLYQSLDGVSYSEIAETTASTPVGFVIDGELFPHDGSTIDRVSELRVQLTNDAEELQSISYSELANLGNMAFVNGEIIQFMNAVHDGGGEYILTTFVRGRAGTDDLALLGSDYLGFDFDGYPNFALLDSATVSVYYDSIARKNVEVDYKAVSTGETLETTVAFAQTNTGRKLKPYSPVFLHADRDGSGATIKWSRRDRFYHYMQSGVEINMSEAYLQFEVEIWNDARDTLHRTFVVDDAEEILYTTADQTTDFGSPPTNFNVTIYQIGDTIGRGLPALARV